MINYKLVNKVNPRDVLAVQKFYPVKQKQETLSIRDLAKRISRESTVSMMDTTAVLEGFLQVIPNELTMGRIVKLGDFGTFRTTLSGEGVAEESEFTVSKIKKLNIRFRPAREFKDLLANVKYGKVS